MIVLDQNELPEPNENKIIYTVRHTHTYIKTHMYYTYFNTKYICIHKGRATLNSDNLNLKLFIKIKR